MADLRTLTLGLLVKDDQFRKGLKDSQKRTESFSSKLGSVLKKGAIAFAALGVAAGAFAIKIGKDALLAAGDFNEEISKSETIFGDVAKNVQDFAKNATSSLLLNRGAALKAASTFAIFGKSAGLSGQELADFSTDFVGLAADLASFNNTSPEEAIQAIGSALRGEAEPIRSYGVLMDEASLRQIAFREGIIKTTKDALTPQQKVLAVTKLLYEQTLDAQGDIDRTRDSFANTLKGFKQRWEDLRIEIGEQLLPVFDDILQKLKDLQPTFETFIKTLFGGPQAITSSGYYAHKALENLGEDMGENEWAGFNLAMAIRDLVEAFGELFTTVEENTGSKSPFADFLNDITEVLNGLASIIRFIDKIGETWNKISGGMTSFFVDRGIVNQTAGNPFAAIQSQTPSRVPDRSLYNQVNNINVRGAVDPQGTARTVTRVLTQQRAISGVRVTAPSGFF
jgi:hypothetical protein